MVTERLEFLVCLTDVLSQSKSTCKLLQMILLPAVGYMDVTRQPSVMHHALLTFCTSSSNGPILIPFVANCS